MTREDLKDIIAAQLHIDPADIAENTSITDELGADSLDIVEMLLTLERVVNIVHDDAVRKLRDDFPQMKDADVRLLCYIFGGFSPQVISLFMHDSVANVYARKSRLKSRIRTSEAPHKELFLALLG